MMQRVRQSLVWVFKGGPAVARELEAEPHMAPFGLTKRVVWT